MTFVSAVLKKFGTNQVIPIVTAILSIVYIWLGLERYGFWGDRRGPLPGFFPVIIAVILLLVSIYVFIFSFRDKKPEWPVSDWVAVLGCGSIIVSTYIIGLLPSLFIYLLVWLKKYEKCTWKTTIITMAVTLGIIYGTFSLWLGVPFPEGFIRDMWF